MKKICYITTIPLTLDMFVLESAKYIHENTDWDITFVCNDDEDFAKRLPDYIHFHPIKMKRGISPAGIKAMFEMKSFFEDQKFDLIQYSTPNAALYASMAGKLANVPVRLYCQWGMAFVGFTGIKRGIFKTIEKTVCKLSTWIEPDSNSNLIFSHKEGLYPETVGSVIWKGSACGVNLSKFDVSKKEKYRQIIRERYGIPKDAFVFGYVGRITRDKGVNELLEAAKTILSENKNVYLLLVGPEEVDETINHDLYKWAKESKQVLFTGFSRVVEQFMSAMDCYVLPSYREGFGMSVVEAEAMAVPVIITNIPGPIDGMINGQTGLVVEKKNAFQLTEAMKKMVISDLEYYGNNGLELARNGFEQKQLFAHILEDRKRLLGDEQKSCRKALFCYDGPLYKDCNDNYYDSILNDQMFERYFKVAEKLEVIIRIRDIDSRNGNKRMDRITNPNISVVECPNLSSVSGLIKGHRTVVQILEERIKTADVVFIRLPSVIGNIAVDVCKKNGKKYLIEVVGCPWDAYWNYSLKGKLVAPGAMMLMKKKIENAPYVLYVTNQFLQHRYPTNGKQISCSNVELAPMSEEILTRRLWKIKNGGNIFNIGTAAGLDVLYKGQQYVIKALGELKKEGITNIEYQLIGGGTGDYLKKIAQECGVENQVKILGQLPHEEVFKWLDDLDAYIQPSRQEGLPRSVIEGMSRGLPCFGARTAGIPELLDSGCVFSNKSTEVEEITNLLKKIINDKELQERQAKRNFEEAKKYQRETLVERRTQFFEACVEGR